MSNMNRKLLLIISTSFILSCTYTGTHPEKTQNDNDTTNEKSKSDTSKIKKTKTDNKIYYTEILSK